MISFIRAEARWLLAGFVLTLASGFGQTFFISLSNTALMARFDLSHGGIAFIYATGTLTSAVILLEFGRIVDRVTTRTSAMISVAGLALACLVVAFASATWMLFFGFLGLRLFGQGMMSHVAMTATGRWYEANRGRAVSLVALGHPVSEAVLPPLGVALLVASGVVGLWSLAAGLLVFVAAPVLFMLLLRERTPRSKPGSGEPVGADHIAKCSWRRRQVLGEPAFWVLLTGVLCPAFMSTGLFFHQLHLIALEGWSAGVFAAGFSVFAATALISSLIAGALVDRFSARALLPFYLLPLALALTLPALLDGTAVIFVMMALLGVMGGFAGAIMGAIWPELFGGVYLGEIRALAFAAMVASSATSPLLTGMLIDAGVDFTLQLAVMGGYALLASALMGLIQPRLAAIACDRVVPSQPAF